MAVMNKSLQIHVVKQLLEKHGIDPQSIDIEAEIDSTLTLEENIKNLSKKLGIPLTKALEEIRMNKLEDDYIEQKNKELLEEYLRMNGLYDELEEIEEQDPSHDILEEMRIHGEQIDKLFSELVQKVDPLKYFSRLICPELQGEQWDKIREAILLSLVTNKDGRKRVRIHVLLHGQAGTGKTEMLLWLRDKLGAEFIGKHTSEVGLIGDARGKEFQYGALAEAHGNVLCIDELDKFKKDDLNGLLEAMEEGQYTVRKGRIKEKVKAEVRIIASANDIDKLPKALLDRFDFVFELKVPPRDKRAEASEKIVESFFSEDEEDKTELLREYLNWVRDFSPKPEGLDRMKELVKAYIKLTNANIDELSYRSLEMSILRIAYALAKLRKTNVTPEHVLKSIIMKDQTLSSEQIRYLTAIAKGLI